MGRKSTRSETVLCENFSWRIYKDGRGIYQAEHRTREHDVRRSLRHRDRQQALRALQEVDRWLRDQIDGSRSNGRTREVTIGEGIQLMLASRSAKMSQGRFGASSLKKYEQVLAAFSSHAGRRRLTHWSGFTPAALQQFLTDMHETRGLSSKSLNGYARIVHGVFVHLIEEQRLLSRELMFRYREVPEIRDRRHVFTDEQVDAMLERARAGVRTAWMYPVLLTLARTGVRRDELRNIRWEDLDFDRGLLVVVHAPDKDRTTKGKKSRRVPLTQDVVEALAGLKRHPDGFVFRSKTGCRLNPDNTLAAFKKEIVTPLAGRFPPAPGETSFADSVLHSFRHYAINLARRKGMSPELRREIFGHEDEETHDLYQDIKDDELLAWQRAMSGGATQNSRHGRPTGTGSIEPKIKSNQGPRVRKGSANTDLTEDLTESHGTKDAPQ